MRPVPSEPLLQLALVVVLGATAQWLAWKLRLPSILLLLATGFAAGPVLGWVDPDALLGKLLSPLVSLSVAMILFEGGLNLSFAELRGVGRVIGALVTVGAGATWLVATVAARALLGLEWSLATLLGAILVLTGPTVVLPMLRYLRPSGRVGAILKWEGIVIDPIGALLAVLVFEVIVSGQDIHAPTHVALAIGRTLLIGGLIGLASAALLVLVLERFWAPDHLQTTVSIMLVIGAFVLSHYVQPESGLLTVTVMGVALANQSRADIRAIAEFKENLQVFLLSVLFILLSARLTLADMAAAGVGAVAFVAVLIGIARPLCVALATAGSALSWRERLFLAWMAPRGIVAAAVTSVFALALEQAGFAQARLLTPVAFVSIVGTVLFYGLSAARVAKWLGLAEPDPQGLVLIGANRFGRAVAQALHEQGIRVLLVDTNRANVSAARMDGLEAFHGNVLTAQALERLDLAGIGRALVLTPSNDVNLLIAQRFVRVFGRAKTYQLPLGAGGSQDGRLERHLHGRWLFREDATFERLDDLCEHGATVKLVRLTEQFGYGDFQARYGREAIPLFVLTARNRLEVVAAGDKLQPGAGDAIVSLVPPAGSGD